MKSKRNILEQDSAVVKRWVRLKSVAWVGPPVRSFMRVWLTFSERKKKVAMKAAFEEVKNQAINLEHSNYHASKVFMNIGLYFLIAERDIQSVKIDALTHADLWKRNLSLRIILLTIYEWDMDKVTGKKLCEAMNAVKLPERLRNEVTESLRELRKAQSAAKKKLFEVRNYTIAHRDPDALLQYRLIRNLNSSEVLSVAVKFYSASHRFIKVLPEIVLEGGSLQALFRQTLEKSLASVGNGDKRRA